MPTGSILMLDVTGLDRVAPAVLNAGSAAGVAGGHRAAAVAAGHAR